MLHLFTWVPSTKYSSNSSYMTFFLKRYKSEVTFSYKKKHIYRILVALTLFRCTLYLFLWFHHQEEEEKEEEEEEEGEDSRFALNHGQPDLTGDLWPRCMHVLPSSQHSRSQCDTVCWLCQMSRHVSLHNLLEFPFLEEALFGFHALLLWNQVATSTPVSLPEPQFLARCSFFRGSSLNSNSKMDFNDLDSASSEALAPSSAGNHLHFC